MPAPMPRAAPSHRCPPGPRKGVASWPWNGAKLGGALRHGLAVVLALLLLNACTTPETITGYREAIVSFETATDETRTAMIGRFTELNTYERSLELTRLRADPERTLDVNRLTEPLFSTEAIRVRELAFATISAYTTHLADLADSEAPTRWRMSAQSLRENAQALASTLDDDPRAARAGGVLAELSGPLSTLVGLIGEDYLSWRRERALDAAIADAAPAIARLSDLLARDVATVIFQRTRTLNEPLIDARVAYLELQANVPLSPPEERRRQEILKGLEATLAANARVRDSLDPMREALMGFDRAHAALLAYARSSQVTNLAALQLAVRRYREVARDLHERYQARRAGDGEVAT